MAPSLEVTPAEVKLLLDAGAKLALIDVREQMEFQIARIAGAEPIPMADIPAALPHLESLADDGMLIVYCHHGVRSLSVVNWLRSQGVEECASMAGGIDRWSLEVDPSVPRY